MAPCLNAGDVVVVQKHKNIEPGDVIVLRHPFQSTHMIKRVHAIDVQGRYDVRGDNPAESTDSRSFGAVSSDLIVGVVTSMSKR